MARGGVIDGARCLVFVAQWSMASHALGKAITLEEFRDWWRISHGSAYRSQRLFRGLFPALPTPQPIANRAIARAQEWQEQGVKGFGALPAADVVGVS